MPTAKLKVSGLQTADDERDLAAAVRRLDGVYGVVASCRDHCMEVDFEDDQVGIDDLLAAASTAGFQATLIG